MVIKPALNEQFSIVFYVLNKTVLSYVPRVLSCPTYLTCLRALFAHVPYVPACLWYLRVFLFYMPYVPSFFKCPHFYTCLTRFYFFTYLVRLHFLRALRAFIFLRVLHAFIFYMPHVSSFIHVLTCCDLFACLMCLHF